MPGKLGTMYQCHLYPGCKLDKLQGTDHKLIQYDQAIRTNKDPVNNCNAYDVQDTIKQAVVPRDSHMHTQSQWAIHYHSTTWNHI